MSKPGNKNIIILMSLHPCLADRKERGMRRGEGRGEAWEGGDGRKGLRGNIIERE